MSLTQHWSDLVASALLGTDRRLPPAPPPGPLAELLLETPAADDAGALVLQVAALTAMRRAGAVPAAVPALLVPPAPDDRPVVPAAAADLLRHVLTEWPLLEPEWLELAASGGWRLSGDLVPPLLARHRNRPERRQAVEQLTGPLAAWLVDHVPSLAAGNRASAPEVPVALPPELQAVVTADAAHVARSVITGLASKRYTAPGRAVLEHLVARVRADQLVELAARLDQMNPDAAGVGVAYRLAELATVRATMHRLLAPADRRETT